MCATLFAKGCLLGIVAPQFLCACVCFFLALRKRYLTRFHVASRFVPSSPLTDPLHFNLDSSDLNYEHYEELCELSATDEGDWKGLRLRGMAQEVQNDWFGSWVYQMAYIAKPNASIVVENVADEYCRNYHDWGGVSKEWWANASRTYHWDVDPTTIAFTDDFQLYKHGRYHVYMRKNEK